MFARSLASSRDNRPTMCRCLVRSILHSLKADFAVQRHAAFDAHDSSALAPAPLASPPGRSVKHVEPTKRVLL